MNYEKAFKQNVNGCSRCGGNHDLIEFKPLNNPPEGITHWGICPLTSQPILMLVKNDNLIGD